MKLSIYDNLELDRLEIAQDDLNIEQKVRSNPLPWNGQFSPQFVEVLLNHYASEGSFVFDPFLGSGTILLECGRQELSAAGSEINPAAATLARLYKFINVTEKQRSYCIELIEKLLRSEFPDPLPLFQGNRSVHTYTDEVIKTKIIQMAAKLNDLNQKYLIDSVIVLLDFHHKEISLTRLFNTWVNVKKLVASMPYSKREVEVYQSDARKIPIPDASVDLVITSPPYINVFNYHQRYRASMEALNWDILEVAKSEIGANRKFRGNRFFTVVQFCVDISQVFLELVRVCKNDSRVIFVVGRESAVRGTRFYNGKMVAEIANRALGFKFVLRQERVFMNRFGKHIYEDILHFQLPHEPIDNDIEGKVRDVALDVLEEALLLAGTEQRSQIISAIKELPNIQASPLFNTNLNKISN